MKPTKFVILYAEDDLDDLEIVQECFAHYSHLIEILHVENGKAALSALDHLHARDITPCLIILDINMPVMNGRQALEKIKSVDTYQAIPIVVFTTSNSKVDKSIALKWGADFITKPLQVQALQSLAQDFARRCEETMVKRA